MKRLLFAAIALMVLMVVVVQPPPLVPDQADAATINSTNGSYISCYQGNVKIRVRAAEFAPGASTFSNAMVTAEDPNSSACFSWNASYLTVSGTSYQTIWTIYTGKPRLENFTFMATLPWYDAPPLTRAYISVSCY